MFLRSNKFKNKIDARRDLERLLERYFGDKNYTIFSVYRKKEYFIEITYIPTKRVVATYPIKIVKTRRFCMPRYRFEALMY
jgi:hypothetical protein